MRSYGRIAYDAYYKEKHGVVGDNWMGISQLKRDAWEKAAEAVISEHERRKPDPEDENPKDKKSL